MLPPPGYFADSPWEPCEVCGTQRLKADKRPCRRCKTPRKVDLLMAGAAPTTIQLLERWFLDSDFSYTLNIFTGTAGSVDPTGPELRDNSDLTFAALSVDGDGVDVGFAEYGVSALLGQVQSFKPVTAVTRVDVTVRARVVTTGGSTSVIYTLFDGAPFPAGSNISVPPLPDDFLSPPPAAFSFTTITNSYTLDPATVAPWDYARIKAHHWGFRMIDQGLTATSSDEIQISRMAIDLWGPA